MTDVHDLRGEAPPHPPVWLQKVLVAFDGSPAANRALEFALGLARGYGCELILCNAVDHAKVIAEVSSIQGCPPGLDTVLTEIDEAAETALSDALTRATAAGARASTTLLDGRAAPAIVACVKQRTAGAIVIGTQGKRGVQRMFLGSTAEGVLRAADVPTFVLHAEAAVDTTAQGFRRILVALDESDPSDAALDFALELAAANHSRLLCCTAVDTADLLDKAATYGYDPTPMYNEMHRTASDLVETKARNATERGLAAHSIVVEGHAADAILKAAADHEADLIAIGTHGRRGLRRLFVGSVAESLVRRSVLPVVVVRGSAR